MNRRHFLKTTAGATMLGCFPAGLSGIERARQPGMLERRPLGKTGEMLSVIGFGGIVVKDLSAEDAARHVKEAVGRGVNYFDVAPLYGNAEEMLGPALEPFRKEVFLACKTQERTRDGARRDLERSLARLRTGHLDLYQLHAVTKPEEVETVFGEGGAMETLLAAREEGKVRFLGFSAHSVEAAMMLMDRFAFDTILFPVNAASWHAGGFGPQVLARAREKGMGILALKAMAVRPYAPGEEKTPKCWYRPAATPEEAALGLRFTLSHPITAAIPPGNETLFRMALDLALAFEPLSEAEAERIKETASAEQPLFRYPNPKIA
jgi:aryl-alcohol dehydrogenase-like predicted oxidoreductase